MRYIRILSPVLMLIAAMILSGCGRKAPVPAPAAASSPVMIEEGMASWYGQPHHGRPTASGEIYDMERLTAAHRTLPFGTQVRVESFANHRTVDVRINDRGPSSMDRIIDLSRAAAHKLAMIGPGTARVRLEVHSLLRTADEGHYAVQVGAFQDKRRAEKLRQEMGNRFGDTSLQEVAGNPTLWRVLVGRTNHQEAADELAKRIRRMAPEKAAKAFPVHF